MVGVTCWDNVADDDGVLDDVPLPDNVEPCEEVDVLLAVDA